MYCVLTNDAGHDFQRGYIPFMAAAEKGHKPVVEYLLHTQGEAIVNSKAQVGLLATILNVATTLKFGVLKLPW